MLFRTGGRHHGARLRVRKPRRTAGGAIVPGRYYGVASADAIHWVDELWGVAAFVDAGNAVDSLSGAHFALGYGVGARVRTPLGPFRLDVAYGQDVHTVRVHFSVGLDVLTAKSRRAHPTMLKRRTRGRRNCADLAPVVARALVATGVLLAALVVAGAVLLSGQAGIDLVVRELVARSGGALEIDDATGSLFDTVRIRRVAWHGPDTQVSADDVALTWNPSALLSRGIVVRGLGAQRLMLETNASTGDVPLPQNLALPIEVRIEHLGIGQLDWRVGTSRGALHGLAFAYSGGAAGHRVSAVTFVAAMGAITGDATIGAAAPFPVAGRLDAKGDAALADVDADITLGGTLAALTLDGSGNAGAARFTGRASLAPLAAASLREAALDASGIDLAAWNATLPSTGLTVAVRARPADGAIAGTIEATNAAPGSIDAGRLPASHAGARFAWRDDALSLDSMAATLAGSGTLAGQGRMPSGVAGAAGVVDPRCPRRRFAAALCAARHDAAVRKDSSRISISSGKRIRGDVADRTITGGVALDFAAVVADGAVDVERFRARSGKGELAGRGRLALSGERAFELDATALRFDPARYGAFPGGALDGRIVATGTLAPAWRVHADIALAAGSRLAGVALAGTARGTFARSSIRDAAIDLSVGSRGSRQRATRRSGRSYRRHARRARTGRTRAPVPRRDCRTRSPAHCTQRQRSQDCRRRPASISTPGVSA